MEPIESAGANGTAGDSVSSEAPTRKPKERSRALPRRLCGLADAAAFLAVSDWTVRQMVWRGDLPHIKCGKRILLDLQDLTAWIDREKVRGV